MRFSKIESECGGGKEDDFEEGDDFVEQDFEEGDDFVEQDFVEGDDSRKLSDDVEVCEEEDPWSSDSFENLAQYAQIRVLFFIEEEYLDFKNFTHPFQKITKEIAEFQLFEEGVFRQPTFIGKRISLQANEVELSDTPYQNPWDESPDTEREYLTMNKVNDYFDDEEEDPRPFVMQFYLDDTKILRGRSVYDIITLVSEVSGLADIFFVGIAFVIGVLYTPLLLEASLHEHMG